MTEDDFQTLLDARGPDPAAWGPWQRLRARRLLRVSPQARRRLDEARTLARALETLDRGTTAPAALRARLHRIPAGHPRPGDVSAASDTLPALPARWWTAGAAVGLTCFLAGVALGAVWLEQPSEVDLATVVYAQITNEEDWR